MPVSGTGCPEGGSVHRCHLLHVIPGREGETCQHRVQAWAGEQGHDTNSGARLPLGDHTGSASCSRVTVGKALPDQISAVLDCRTSVATKPPTPLPWREHGNALRRFVSQALIAGRQCPWPSHFRQLLATPKA